MWRAVGRFAVRHNRGRSSAAFVSNDTRSKIVLGCGSNVVDHIYNVKVIPRAGEKGYFRSPLGALTKLLGGVTVNHLCWASLAGVPTGLLALQGHDELGHFIRSGLRKRGVSVDFIKAELQYSTAQCHVFVQEDGERSIVMAPAATSLMDRDVVKQHFSEAVLQSASMVTTEISQVPLSGVIALLKSAREAGVLSMLDVDVPPSVAIHEARLGSSDELLECLRLADIVKPAKVAANELLGLLRPTDSDRGDESLTLSEIARELVGLCHSKLVVITNGCHPCIVANSCDVVEVDPPTVERVVDTTGAGDAFLGGLIVAISRQGLPETKEALKRVGEIANACGATCVQSLGGVPDDSSSTILRGYLPSMDFGAGNMINIGFNSSVECDAEALATLMETMDVKAIPRFIDVLEQTHGQILVSGVGKSGHVAQRFSSSLSSVGILSHFVHATEFVHGDLGKAYPGRDAVIFLSNSGNTHECVVAASNIVARGVAMLAITGNKDSKLNKMSTAALTYNSKMLKEPFDCVPTSSVIVQESLCNAVLSEIIQRRGISKDVFKLNHPGGSIGVKLSVS